MRGLARMLQGATADGARSAAQARRVVKASGVVAGMAKTCACGGGCERCRARTDHTFEGPTPAIVGEVLRQPGRALAGAQEVRIHTGERAAVSARAVRAKAYTVGRHIVFGEGEFRPETAAGRALIAHELGHVQEQRGRAPVLQRKEDDEAPPPPADACAYEGGAVQRREIHLNLRTNSVRIYTRVDGREPRVREYTGLITGPRTRALAREVEWCPMFRIASRIAGPTGWDHGLINFVVFCPAWEIGFHSTLWRDGGEFTTIPGEASAGCARIPHGNSRAFFDAVREGDCVRIYDRAEWRAPTFRACDTPGPCVAR